MIVDARGRLFGRLNLFDALVAGVLLALVPLAYATYLLFRPAAPVISSVERVPITREELRLAGGSHVSAKLKVRGSGFSPLLRAAIGSTPALGFVFENPNSADVIVGDVAPGTYDLVLLDGVQEVARAAGAVVLQAGPARHVRAVGYLTPLPAAHAEAFRPGDHYPPVDPRVHVLALGPVRPAMTRVMVGDRVADTPLDGHVERSAVLRLRCDQGDEPCVVGGYVISGERPTAYLPAPEGVVRFVVDEVLPDAPPRQAHVTLRLAGGPELNAIAVGDRDALLDERAAVVTAIAPAGPGAVRLQLTLGVDASREGWRYRGALVRPGAALTLRFPRVEAQGTVQQLDVLPSSEPPR